MPNPSDPRSPNPTDPTDRAADPEDPMSGFFGEGEADRTAEETELDTDVPQEGGSSTNRSYRDD